MKNILPTLLISGSLALLSNNKAFGSDKISNNSLEVKDKTIQILENKNLEENILEEKLKQLNIEEDLKKEIKDFFNDENFKKELYKILKKEYSWSLENVILALILGFLFGFAYYGTIKKVRDEHIPIVVGSFLTFSLTSGGMVLINGFIPGSLVYFESFLLALYVVYLHLKNQKEGKVQRFENFTEFIEENPLPIVRYDKNGKPILWNKKMQEETGYSLDEILDYFNKNKEVMSLLYTGKNLDKVKIYLEKIKETGIGYKNIAFTMTTKYGEEKTFLWTTIPDGQGGTIRTARLLTDENEIKRELRETQKLLRLDYLTGALNKKAFEDDLEKIFSINFERKNEIYDYILVYLDVDNFKGINDLYGHDFGDFILKNLSKIIQDNIRSEDRIYRLGGDEFALLFNSSDIDTIAKKIDFIRNLIFKFQYNSNNINKSNIGTSWGIYSFNVFKLKKDDKLPTDINQKIKSIKEKVDYYMYAVKYFKLILPELKERGLDLSKLDEKNGLSYPLFRKDGEFIGVKVIKTGVEFILSVEELDLINKRKKENVDKISQRNI